MNGQVSYLFPVLPELVVLIAGCVILLAGVFFPKKQNLSYYLTQITLVITAVLVWAVYYRCASQVDMPLLAFANGFILDKLSVFLNLLILVCTFFTFMYARAYNTVFKLPENEFYVLGLYSVLGMMVLVSGYDFITLFLGLELLSLPIYAMIAFQRTQRRAVEASLKYFLIGAVASALLLYGMSILFAVTQSIEIGVVSTVIAQSPGSQWVVVLFAMVFIITGVCFKLGVAPFHMWVPDVFDGAPNAVTLFLSVAPKVAAFGLLIRLLIEAMPSASVGWQEVIIVVSILSMAVGNIAAIIQTNIKRMLAYSSIAHGGYLLLGIACATSRGYSASLFYMMSYAVMSLGSFGMIVMLSYTGYEVNNIDDLFGLNARNPWLAFIMLLVMFSMAGIPPLVGFMAKVGVLEALIHVHLTWLAVLAIIFAIIGAYYYIRVIKVMYFEEPYSVEPIPVSFDAKVAVTINGMAVLLLGMFPGIFYTLCSAVF